MKKNDISCTFIDNSNSPFIRYWTFLMREPYCLSRQQMELYSIMHDRQMLSNYSVKNGDTKWKINDNRIYFFLEASQIQSYMGIGNRKWLELKTSLIECRLLQVEERKGYPTKFFLKTVDKLGIETKEVF